jgi:hypothetical protein
VCASAERPLFAELRSELRKWRKGAALSDDVVAAVEETVAAEPGHDQTLVPVADQ